MYSEVILAGGTTLMSDFPDRMLSETKKLIPKDIRVIYNTKKQINNFNININKI